jgi:acyl-coenzyme A thioesterase PaaI-like protein
MGYSCAQALGWASSLVTISLAVDYLGNGEIGQWLSVEGEVIKTGSTICFAQSLVRVDDTIIARANGTFRVVKKAPVQD